MGTMQVNLQEQVKGYYIGAKASITALTGVPEGSIGYATDTNQFGSYDGSSWTWGQIVEPINTLTFAEQFGPPSNPSTGNYKLFCDSTGFYVRNASGVEYRFAKATELVTNGDSHDHNGGDGAQINHTTLSNVGTNTHAQIDTHIAATSGANAHNMREVLTATRTYYVRTDGSDSNDGLANTAGGAFLTIQKAVNVASALDNGGYDVTIQIADGTYTGTITLKSYVGAGTITIQGNSGTPANVDISITSNNAFTAAGVLGKYILKDFKVRTTTSGSCIVASQNSVIEFTNLNFGATAGDHMQCSTGASITATGNYAVSGGAVRHIVPYINGLVDLHGRTITYSNSPAFSTYNMGAEDLSEAYIYGMTFTNGGTVTGKRYSVVLNGVMNTNSGGANYVPGNSAGTTATGGQYV